MLTSVRAVGLEGRWRLRHSEYQCSKDMVIKGIEEDMCLILEEEHNFFLIELQVSTLKYIGSGCFLLSIAIIITDGITYVQADSTSLKGSEVVANDILFKVKGIDHFIYLLIYIIIVVYPEKRIVHGKTTLLLDKTRVIIYAVSPQHGNAIYAWEHSQFLSDSWVPIDVPRSTCLLTIDQIGLYRCFVDNECITFEVKYPIKQNSDGEAL